MANPFDHTFDHTFRASPAGSVSAPIGADVCIPVGYQLGWLTGNGWAYWLFEGRAVASQSVASLGSFALASGPRDTQRETTPGLVLRTSGLTQIEADVLSTLPQSIAVYWLREAAGIVSPTRIYVATGEYVVWNEADKSGLLEIRASLPPAKSFRN